MASIFNYLEELKRNISQQLEPTTQLNPDSETRSQCNDAESNSDSDLELELDSRQSESQSNTSRRSSLTEEDDESQSQSQSESDSDFEEDQEARQRKLSRQLSQRVIVLDPSEHFRPEEAYKDLELHGKAIDEFRHYTEENMDPVQARVRRTYYEMHKNQTVGFVRHRLHKWTRFNHGEMTIMEALDKLNNLIDESDPDNDLPNIVHAFQTAERIRAQHPDKPWLQLTGLIHDLGKIMCLFGEQQWAVVGDTYVVGCEYGSSIVYRERSFDQCPDLYDKRYNTKYGIYEPNCGLDNVLFSWGHDEYMARVLQNHKQCTLPKEAIQIIRLHSFYPWHSGGDYMHLCNEQDMKLLPLIRDFNRFDLYTKSAPVPDMEALMPYYQSLIDKYIPGKVKF